MRAIRSTFVAVLSMYLFAAAASAVESTSCDLNGDRVVNQLDVRQLMASINTSAIGRSDPRDVDGDGRITLNDLRVCLAQCMAKSCQTLNVAPTANAGPDQSATSGAIVYLSGAQSTDPDGPQPLSYSWKFRERPQGSHGPLVSADTVAPSFVVDRPGRYVIGLVVHDGLVASAADEVVVSSVNSAPVANAGPDQSVFVGDVARLSGTSSTDVDGDPLDFDWTLLSKPPGSNATLQRVLPLRQEQMRLAIDAEGTYVVQLVVSDGKQSSAPDTVVITTGNTRPVANPKASCAPLPNTDCSTPIATVVTVDAGASTDVDGDPLTYAWAMLSRPPGSAAALSTPSAITAAFTADVPGSFVVQLIVNDGVSNSAPKTLNVTSTNARPVAVATVDPISIATLPRLVQLDGTRSVDPEGQGVTYAWSLLARPAGSTAALSSATAAQPTFMADVVGTYTAQLIVSDGFLASLPVTASASTANQPPSANAGPDLTVVAGAIVQLASAGSSDPEGAPLGFFWSMLSKPAGSVADFSNANAANPTFPADRKGTYVAQLIVNDGVFNSGPDTVQITATNRAPVAVVDSYVVAQDGSLAVGAAQGVLANDTDADGDALAAILVGAAPTGLSLGATGAFTYTPPAGFSGTTTFQYKANDGAADSNTVTATITVTPGLPVVSVTATTPNASEAGPVSGAFTITRSGGNLAASLDVSVAMSGTAANNIDYSFIGAQAIPAGQTSVVVPVVPIPDGAAEGDETAILTIAASAAYSIGTPSAATVTISDPALPTVTVVATQPNASETGPVSGRFTFTRTGSTAAPLLVRFSPGGTAGRAADYVDTSIEVTIPAGQASVDVPITPVVDAAIEGDESVVFTIVSAAAYTVGSPSVATVTIADGVPNVLTVVATDPAASEIGLDPGSFTITRTGPTTFALHVNFVMSGTATRAFDYVDTSFAATIPAGQASVTIPIVPIADARIEPDETVIITLTPTPAVYLVGAQNTAMVTVADGIPNVITVVATDPAASETGLDPGSFTITRTGPTTFALPVDFVMSGTATRAFDYVDTSFATTIPAGQASVTIPIVPIADAVIESDETVIITLSPSPAAYIVGAQDAATVTIADGIPNVVTVVATDPDATEATLDPGMFTFTRTGPTTFALNLSFVVTGTAGRGSDYVDTTFAITIPAGQASVSLPIVPLADATVEGDETVIVTLMPIPATYLIGAQSSATVTIH